MYTKEEAFIDN